MSQKRQQREKTWVAFDKDGLRIKPYSLAFASKDMERLYEHERLDNVKVPIWCLAVSGARG